MACGENEFRKVAGSNTGDSCGVFDPGRFMPRAGSACHMGPEEVWDRASGTFVHFMDVYMKVLLPAV